MEAKFRRLLPLLFLAANAAAWRLPSPKRSFSALGPLRASVTTPPDPSAPSSTALDVPSPPLLKQPLRKALWSVAWPTITIGLMRSLYDLVDAFWLGRLGLHQLEAVGAVSFALWIIFVLGELAGIGVHSLTSGAEGAGRRQDVGPLITQGLWVALGVAVACLAAIPFTGSYFGLLGLGKVSEAWGYGQSYLRWSLLGALPLLASGVVAAGFKGIGSMRPVLGVTAVCVACNAVLDPLFIWGWKGIFPAMGVAGAAIGTQVSNWLALFLSLRALRKQGVQVPFQWPKLQRMRSIVGIGGPMALAGIAFTAVYIVLGRILRGLGDANLAALGLGHRVEGLAFVITEGFGAAAATMVGQWLGAGNAAQARKAARVGSTLSSLLLTGAAAATILCAGPIVSVFTSDPAVWAAAVSYLRIVSFIFPAMAQEMVYEGALAGAGDTVNAFYASFCCNIARIPMAFYLSQSYGVQGVWYAICISTLAKSVVKKWFFDRSRLPLLRLPAGASGSGAALA